MLDAGVGSGSFAEVVTKKGGEVVGVDLTTAVDAAHLNIGARERVHLIQADIFALPFRDSTFDLAYSIGVLHHTPDPQTAFQRGTATVTHRFSDPIPPLPDSMHPNWRWLDTFDCYTPKYEWNSLYPEVFRWSPATGFSDVEIFDRRISMRGIKTA